jgi:hypothetical protein
MTIPWDRLLRHSRQQFLLLFGWRKRRKIVADGWADTLFVYLYTLWTEYPKIDWLMAGTSTDGVRSRN